MQWEELAVHRAPEPVSSLVTLCDPRVLNSDARRESPCGSRRHADHVGLAGKSSGSTTSVHHTCFSDAAWLSAGGESVQVQLSRALGFLPKSRDESKVQSHGCDWLQLQNTPVAPVAHTCLRTPRG